MSFRCCKTKIISCYVCKTCFGVYHKSCLTKKKGAIHFISGNIINCCNNDASPDTEQEEISSLEKTINELNDDSINRERYIKKLKDEHESFLKEAVKSELELNSLVQQQEKTIKEMQDKIANMHEEISKYKVLTKNCGTQTINKEMQNQATCTSTDLPYRQTSGQTSGEYINQSNRNADTNKIRDFDVSIENIRKNRVKDVTKTDSNLVRKNILLISDQNGRYMADSLRRQAGDKYLIHSILKPNSCGSELMHTTIANCKKYNKTDIIILWSKNYITNINMLKNRLSNNERTPHLIFITEPYRYDVRNANRVIYNSNLALTKYLHEVKMSHNKIECNGIIKRMNYNIDGYSLKRSAKWYLSKALLQHIETYFNLNRINTHTTYQDASPTIHQLLQTQIFDLQQQTCEEKDDFLYPRLSQMSLISDHSHVCENELIYPRLSQISKTFGQSQYTIQECSTSLAEEIRQTDSSANISDSSQNGDFLLLGHHPIKLKNC